MTEVKVELGLLYREAVELSRSIFGCVENYFLSEKGKKFERPRDFVINVVSVTDDLIRIVFYEGVRSKSSIDYKKVGKFSFAVEDILEKGEEPYCYIKKFLYAINGSVEEDIDVASIYCGVGGVEDIKLYVE